MEDSRRSRCNSLDTGFLFDKAVLNHGDFVSFDPEASEPLMGHEPTPAEVAQCEAEVSTLLTIIAELNKKMGSLKAPSEPGDVRPPRPSRPLVPPDLLSHRLLRSSPESSSASVVSSKHPVTEQGPLGGGGVVWTQLQEVLSSVEDSISFRRTWAAPITASDQNKPTEHLRAAQENWTKATQMLEEMERDFGISCSLGMPKDQNLEDLLNLEKHDSVPRNNLPSHSEELQRAQSNIYSLEEEKNKLVGLHKAWRSDRYSPSYRPPSGALSPDRPPPSYPGSPLLHRRTSRAATPLSLGGDGSPLGSICSSSPCPSPVSLESETERLNRCIERLKARNERLTAALERRKADSEQITMKLSRLESHCSALQMALRKCEECEDAYGELMYLYEAKAQQCLPLEIRSEEPVGGIQPTDGPPAQNPEIQTEELSTSFSTAGVTEETKSHSRQRAAEPADREAALRRQIERLKRERAAIFLPKQPGPGAEVKLGSETGQPAGPRWGFMMKDNSNPPESKREKASLFYELISVREEMSDLRALIRLKEKELRCLEWSLMGLKSQEAAGVFIPENLREEAEDRKTEQRFGEDAAKAVCDDEIPSSLTRPILKELQVVLQREQALKRRVAVVHDSLSTAVSDGSPRRRDNAEQIARLTQAHSKALSSYRQIRRKYREQVWRLEQKVAAMMESQHRESEAAKAPGEGAEWRREETIL